MVSLLNRLVNHLRIVDFMSLFLGKNYLHIGFIIYTPLPCDLMSPVGINNGYM